MAQPKPIFPWQGGKRRLAKRILPLFTDHRCYVEPFAGAGALLFAKEASPVEVLNDVNGEIITLFRVVKFHLAELLRQFEWLLSSREQWELLRDTPPHTLTDVQRSARFLYLQKQAFGGRAKSRSYGTATTARPRFSIYTVEQDLQDAHFRLSTVQLEHLDWAERVRRYDRQHTLFYADPPYWQLAGYGAGEFGWDQYVRLREFADTIKGNLAISINDHPDIRDLFDGLPCRSLDYSYQIGGRHNAKPCTELLITTY